MCKHLGSTEVAFILFVDGIDSTYIVQTYTYGVLVMQIYSGISSNVVYV